MTPTSTGLNRTSVGLKREMAPRAVVEALGLNRTSVGLKPPGWGRGLTSTSGRLNRTSVGLKRDELVPLAASGLRAPQSNQRGIETALGQEP